MIYFLYEILHLFSCFCILQLLKLVSHRLAVRADLERSLKTRLLMHSENLAGAEEEDQEDKVESEATIFDMLRQVSVRL